jgi:hypothetical protein
VRASFVYFLKPADMAGPIKIGVSFSPVNRLRSLMSWSPFVLELLATTPGTSETERVVHSHFMADHHHGEWFNPSPRLLDLIARLTAGEALGDCLDLDLPHVAKRVQAKIPGKQSVSMRVVSAEKWAYGRHHWPSPPQRPSHINHIMSEWQSAFDTRPLAGHRAALLAYAEALKAGPKHPDYVAERARYARPYSLKKQAAAA